MEHRQGLFRRPFGHVQLISFPLLANNHHFATQISYLIRVENVNQGYVIIKRQMLISVLKKKVIKRSKIQILFCKVVYSINYA